jgi:glutathione S-transferase
MITLYGNPLSSYTAKVRIALEFKGIAYTERQPEGGYRSADWRARVPTGTIPAIEEDGFLLAESEAILEYLEERWPQPTMLPGDARDRARIRWLARLHDLHLEPRVRALFPLVRDPDPSALLAERRAALDAQISVLARMAEPRPFLAGSSLSLADCGFAVSLRLAQMILEHLGSALRLPEALEHWLQHTHRQPALAKALEDWQDATLNWLSSARRTS